MSKKVLILSGSPRREGNSDILCDEFMRGAVESGNDVEKVRVADLDIGFCRGCYFCTKHDGECAVKDDMGVLLQKMIDADVIVLSSPVYFYSIDAQLKAVIDRTVARWTEVKDKEFYYIATCADGTDASAETTIDCFRGYAACVSGAKEMGSVLGTGVYQKGEVRDTPAMKEAYELGKSVNRRRFRWISSLCTTKWRCPCSDTGVPSLQRRLQALRPRRASRRIPFDRHRPGVRERGGGRRGDR